MKFRGTIAGLVAILALFLTVAAGFQAVEKMAHARGDKLVQARQAIAEAVKPAADQSPSATREAVAHLLARPHLGLDYVTLREANGAIRVSRGRFTDEFNWLSTQHARLARAWAYRVRSAERATTLASGTAQPAGVRFGVSWWAIAWYAGWAFGLWAILACIGFVALCLVAPRVLGSTIVSEGEPHTKRRTRPRRDKGFAPIGVRPATASPAAAPAASHNARRESHKSARDTTPHETIEVEAPGTEAAPVDAPEQAEIVPIRPDSGKISPAGPVDPAATSTRLGDDTLLLRFMPIWGDVVRETLAAALLVPVWRETGEVVELSVLADRAQKEGALRAFVSWIGHRASLAFENWRTLEINPVPLLLQTPDALLTLPDAEAVWRAALRHSGRDSNDVILVMSPERVADAHSRSLPLRRASAPAKAELANVPVADFAWIDPERLPDDPVKAAQWLHSLSRPAVLGPLAQPVEWADLIERPEVSWYPATNGPDDLLSARTFAKMIVSHRNAALSVSATG